MGKEYKIKLNLTPERYLNMKWNELMVKNPTSHEILKFLSKNGSFKYSKHNDLWLATLEICKSLCDNLYKNKFMYTYKEVKDYDRLLVMCFDMIQPIKIKYNKRLTLLKKDAQSLQKDLAIVKSKMKVAEEAMYRIDTKFSKYADRASSVIDGKNYFQHDADRKQYLCIYNNYIKEDSKRGRAYREVISINNNLAKIQNCEKSFRNFSSKMLDSQKI